MRRFRQGFTMIELAISIVIASVIVAALYSLFNMQSRQLLYLDLQREMNQNLRFAMDVVTRTTRLAGFGTSYAVGGRLGWDGSGASVNSSMPPVISYNDADGSGPDAITVVHMDPSLSLLADGDIPACETTSIGFNNTNLLSSYNDDEYLLCHDFANYLTAGGKAYLWSISSVDTSTGDVTVLSNSSITDHEGLCATGDNLPPYLLCSKGQIVTFYIDDDESDGVGPGSATHPVLMMDLDFTWPEDDDIPLVDNIEDMQFAYCLEDTDCSNTSNWSDSLTYGGGTPWMVRVSMVAKSSRQDYTEKYKASKPALEDNPASSTTDSYYRRVQTSKVTMRNLRFYSNL